MSDYSHTASSSVHIDLVPGCRYILYVQYCISVLYVN